MSRRFLSWALGCLAPLLLCSCAVDHQSAISAADQSSAESVAPPPSAHAVSKSRYVKVLSDAYGVCVRTRFWQQRWQTNSYLDLASATLRFPATLRSGDSELIVGIGRVETSVYELRLVRKSTSGRDILSATDGENTILVTDASAENPDDLVVISFKSSDADANGAALEIADGIFACDVVHR